jgi:hypothetical protein
MSDTQITFDDLVPIPQTITEEQIDSLSVTDLRRISMTDEYFYTKFYNYELIKGKLVRTDFRPDLLSKLYRKLYNVKTMVDDKDAEKWYYDLQKKLYLPGAEDFLASETAKIWGKRYHSGLIEPTIYDLKPRTRLYRDEFKLDPDYLPLKDATLKWFEEDGKQVLKQVEEDYHIFITNRYSVKYMPDAVNQEWLDFLNKHFHAEDLRFIQEFCGSFLTTRSFAMGLVLAGPTKYGKSTFADAIKIVIGEKNVVSVPLHTLEDKFERFRTYNKSLNLIDEMASFTIKESSHVKQILAGAQTSARTLGEASIDFKPYIKTLIVTNSLPPVYDDTESLWNKIQVRLVDRTKHDVDDPRNIKNYAETVLTNGDEKKAGILNWMLKGLEMLRNNHGNFHDLIYWTETREMWDKFADPFTKFFDESNGYVEYLPDARTLREDVFAAYSNEWCAPRGIGPESDQAFFKHVTAKFINSTYPKFRIIYADVGEGKRKWHYIGLRLLHPSSTNILTRQYV